MAGSTRPDRAEQAAGLVERPAEVAQRLGEPDDEQVAERVTFEVAGREAVLERDGPHRRVPGQRDEALAQVTRRGDAEVLAGAGRSSRRRRRRSRPR